MRRFASLGVAIALAAGTLVPAAHAQQTGKTLVLGFSQEPDTFVAGEGNEYVTQVVDNLVYSLRVKLAAQAAGVAAIQADGQTLEIRLHENDSVDLGHVAARHPDVQATRTRLRFQWARAGDGWRERLLALLEELREERAAPVPVAG